MRRKGQFITASTNYLQGIPGYSVNQTSHTCFVLMQFLKTVCVVSKRPMTLFSLGCAVSIIFLSSVFQGTADVPRVIMIQPEVFAIELFPFNYLLKFMPTILKLFSSMSVWEHTFLPNR